MARDPEALRAALVSELVPVIDADTDPQTWDPRELPGVGGNVWKAVIWQERIWYRDEDSLVDHDGLTCIRLLDGVAYLTNDVKFPGFVLSRTLETPPDEEDRAYGDTHRVPAGATDDWAGHEDDVAMWTARGYRFKTPTFGYLHYVVDEPGYEHFSAADAWEDGFGALVFENGSVRPNSLLIRAWSVENQTTNTLPETGPAGEQYIVGPVPTGTAVGQATKIAWRPATDAAFIFTTPFFGEVAFDKDLAIPIRWNGATWESAAGVIVGHGHAVSQSGGTAIAGSGGYAYSASTAPTTASRHTSDGSTLINYAAKRAGARIEIDYAGHVAVPGAITTVAVFRDSETAALDWVCLTPYSDVNPYQFTALFEFDALNTSEHQYSFRIFTNGADPSTFTRRRGRLREFA